MKQQEINENSKIESFLTKKYVRIIMTGTCHFRENDGKNEM